MDLNKVDSVYLDLMQEILNDGVIKKDRTGVGTKSLFGKTLEFDFSEGFPIITTKKMHFKGIVHELLWFLKGDTNIKYLVDNNVSIWNGNAYNYYEKQLSPEVYKLRENIKLSEVEFIEKIKSGDLETNIIGYKLGDLGNVYGKQWRKWEKYGYKNVQNGALISEEDLQKEMYVDQIANVIETLKTNPDSRRIMVNAWNVAEIDNMALPPCHYGFQLYSTELSIRERANLANCSYGDMYYSENTDDFNKHLDALNIPSRKLSLMWNQRSADVLLGIPYNISSYALLLSMISQVTNHIPNKLSCILGDTHLYLNHIKQAEIQIKRSVKDVQYSLPHLNLNTGIRNIDDFTYDDLCLTNYKSHPKLYAKMAV